MLGSLKDALLEIENDLVQRSSEIIGQLYSQTSSFSIEVVSEANFTDVKSIIGTPAILIQLAWDTTENKISLLGNKDILPAVTNLLSGQEEGADQQPMEELKETVSYIFADYATYFSEKLGNEMEFGSPEVQLLEIGADHAIFNESIMVTVKVEIGDINTKICKIIPIETAELFQTVPEPIQEEKVVAEASQFEELKDTGSIGMSRNLDTLLDLDLPVIVELGRAKMQLKNILELGPGGIIELNKFSGEPVDLYVNTKKFAEGEVVIIDQNFGVRITALVSEQERIASLRKT